MGGGGVEVRQNDGALSAHAWVQIRLDSCAPADMRGHRLDSDRGFAAVHACIIRSIPKQDVFMINTLS